MRDLQWRWKRFVIAMVGVALVFALGLIMTGLVTSFSTEVDRTLNSIGAERWAVAADASGPFNSFSPISAADAANIGGSPVMVVHQTFQDGAKVRDIIVMGIEPGALGSPEARAATTSPGQSDRGRSKPSRCIDRRLDHLRWQDLRRRRHHIGSEPVRRHPPVYITWPMPSGRSAGAAAGHGDAVRRDPTFLPAELKVMTNSDVKTM
jgi:hypothetical protein